MSKEFKREDRYFVIKRSDLDKLSPLDRDVVRSNLEHISAILFGWNVPERACLVIESDWPEYEPAWAAIEARVTGKPAEQHQGKPLIHITAEKLAMLRGERKMQDGGLTYSRSEPIGGWTIPLYTRPVEQSVLATDQWPKLKKPALVGAGRFSAGLSARLVVEAAQRHYEYEVTPENETLRIATGENFLALLEQLEQLRGLRPAVPPRPPEGNGLPRYGLRWNGHQQPLATPMDDGYWTPWHLANELRKDAERYQWLRSRDLETITLGGVFAGITPQNMVLNEETLDEAVDAAMAKEA